MLAHIYVAYDGAAQTRAALLRGVLLARQWHARLTIAHVVVAADDEPPDRSAGILAELLPSEAPVRSRLLATIAELTKGVDTDVRVCAGPAGPVMIDLIRSARPDLVVAAPHDRRGLRRFLATSVTDTLPRSHPVPSRSSVGHQQAVSPRSSRSSAGRRTMQHGRQR